MHKSLSWGRVGLQLRERSDELLHLAVPKIT
jgi:hypothetical protein